MFSVHGIRSMHYLILTFTKKTLTSNKVTINNTNTNNMKNNP